VLHGISFQPLALVMQLAPHGSLDRVLQNAARQSPLSHPLALLPVKARMALEIASAMQFLHSRSPPIIHRDLKSPNVLIVSLHVHDPILAQVSDFGTSAIFLHNFRGRVSYCPYWCAPELFQGRDCEYDAQVDVYAFGIILWELCTLQEPFAEFDQQFRDAPTVVFEEAVAAGLRPSLPSSLPPSLAHLIQRCWAPDPRARPPFSEIVALLQSLPLVTRP
jgi:serine/threonine protein kinase